MRLLWVLLHRSSKADNTAASTERNTFFEQMENPGVLIDENGPPDVRSANKAEANGPCSTGRIIRAPRPDRRRRMTLSVRSRP